MSQVFSWLRQAHVTSFLQTTCFFLFLFLLTTEPAIAVIGDIDQSSRVDGKDLIIFSKARNTTTGDPAYNASADLNGDGSIDDTDLAILTDHFGFVGREFSLWVADTNHHQVVKYSAETGVKYLSKGGFYYPIGISVNNLDGTVWVADRNNHRILKLSPQGTTLLTVTGLNYPRSVSVDESDGSCWVTDTNNHRVIKLLPGIPATYNLATDSGSHQTFTGFSSPHSVSVNPQTGECWVADYGNNRIVKLLSGIPDNYNLSSPPPGSLHHAGRDPTLKSTR